MNENKTQELRSLKNENRHLNDWNRNINFEKVEIENQLKAVKHSHTILEKENQELINKIYDEDLKINLCIQDEIINSCELEQEKIFNKYKVFN